jgi:hypothetical protein
VIDILYALCEGDKCVEFVRKRLEERENINKVKEMENDSY